MNISPWISLVASRTAAAFRVGPSLAGFQGVCMSVGMIGSTALGLKTAGVADGFLAHYPFQDDGEKHDAKTFCKTLGRTMIAPGLLEELLWRVAPTPVVVGNAVGARFVARCLLINMGFTLYHLALPDTPDMPIARKVFWDPAFLTMAFVLGNACSLAYYLSGYALWAPVLVHALSVTIWLDGCGGEEKLRGQVNKTKTSTSSDSTLVNNGAKKMD